MDQDRIKQLEGIRDMAIDHAIEEMGAANELTLATKDERGDRAWLTKMCGQSLTIAVRVEQFLMLKDRDGGDYRDDEDQERAGSAFVKRAEAQMKAIMDRSRPEFKHAKSR